MRTTALYFFTCARCGAEVQTKEPEGCCPECGTFYELAWPAEMPQKERTK